MTGSASSEPSWAWLGLLKWSLAYTDGTRPSSLSPMSAEDRAFLEQVMKDGIVNEGERMKTILSELTASLEQQPPSYEEKAVVLLEELRDIVGQIDYARAFARNMGGLAFLLGCAWEADVAASIRENCLSVVSTLCQNNLPVQNSMLEMNSTDTLIDLFLDTRTATDDDDEKLKCKIVQTISASIRNHAIAEQHFCTHPKSTLVFKLGLSSSLTLRKRALFLLQALVTSDHATPDHIQPFAPCVQHVARNYLDEKNEDDADLREMALSFISRILKHDKNSLVYAVMDDDAMGDIVHLGIRRIQSLRSQHNSNHQEEDANVELELWEEIIVDVAKLQKRNDDKCGTIESASSSSARAAVPPAPLMIEGTTIERIVETIF